MRRNRAFRSKQGGAALLLLMLALIIATATVLLASLNRDELRTAQLVATQTALADARTALLDYAILNPDINVGRSITLPCPDIDDTGGYADGEAHIADCGAAGETMIGRLPWRTLGVPALKDSSSACLWYAVSGSYKDAGSATAGLVNTDSNGQLQLFDVDSGSLMFGALPAERPVAMVFAAMRPLTGQVRGAAPLGVQCAPGATPVQYLDTDTGSGISNATLSATADTLEQFAVAAGTTAAHNDRIVPISRADIEARLSRTSRFAAEMRALGLAAARCIANYGATNPGGSSDKRLPWPAAIALADYRPDLSYDDVDNGFFSGRLADTADDSSISIGNALMRTLSNCDSLAVPEWTGARFAAWQNWKDHFFYAVAESFSPGAATPTACGTCLSVNGSGQYAAILLFANVRLELLGQLRDAPPIDADTKRTVSNYLESTNAANFPAGGPLDFVSGAQSNSFNDLLFCIDDQLVVSEC